MGNGRLLLVLLLCFMNSAPALRAFDGSEFFDDHLYRKAVFHLVPAPVLAAEWDYLRGFSANNGVAPSAGIEISWRKPPSPGSLGWFPKLRLMLGAGIRSDYRHYRYISLRCLSPEISALNDVPFPSPELTFNVNWIHALDLAFLSSIRPEIGLGAGAQTRKLWAYRRDAGASTDSVSHSIRSFNYAILSLGGAATVVPDLCEFVLNFRLAFGTIRTVSFESPAGLSAGGPSRFHSSAALSAAMNFYFF